jgi:hypothetical protein
MHRLFPVYTVSLGLCVCLVLSLACSGGPSSREIAIGSEATHDGLYPLDHAHRFQRIWVRPGSSIAGYDKLLPINAGLHYKRPPRKSRGEYPLSETQMTRVQQLLGEVFQEEVTADGSWTMVSEPGPDALIIRGAIIDLVVTANPDPPSGRNRSYTTSLGEATLVIEIFDSQSREILARIADRRRIERETGSWRNDSINNRSATKQVFRSWARRFRQGLENARTNPWPAAPQ